MSNCKKVHTLISPRQTSHLSTQRAENESLFLGKGDINVLVWASLKLFIPQEIYTLSQKYFAYNILEIQNLIFPYIR